MLVRYGCCWFIMQLIVGLCSWLKPINYLETNCRASHDSHNIQEQPRHWIVSNVFLHFEFYEKDLYKLSSWYTIQLRNCFTLITRIYSHLVLHIKISLPINHQTPPFIYIKCKSLTSITSNPCRIDPTCHYYNLFCNLR